jgi:hypothetical protein
MVCLFGTRLYGVYFVKNGDLHLMSVAPAHRGLKSVALAVTAAVSMNNHSGMKILPRKGLEQGEGKEEIGNHSIETVETSNSDLDHVHVLAPVATPVYNTDLVIVSPDGTSRKY